MYKSKSKNYKKYFMYLLNIQHTEYLRQWTQTLRLVYSTAVPWHWWTLGISSQIVNAGLHSAEAAVADAGTTLLNVLFDGRKKV